MTVPLIFEIFKRKSQSLPTWNIKVWSIDFVSRGNWFRLVVLQRPILKKYKSQTNEILNHLRVSQLHGQKKKKTMNSGITKNKIK